MGDMTTPPQAWPEANEDDYTTRKSDLQRVQKGLQAEKKVWHDIQTKISAGRTWSGKAAIAARDKLLQHTDHMQKIDDLLTNAIAFHQNASLSIANAKEDIRAISESAQSEIDDLNKQSAKTDHEAQDRANKVDGIVQRALDDNTHVVDAAGKAITAGQVYQRGGTPAAATAVKSLQVRNGQAPNMALRPQVPGAGGDLKALGQDTPSPTPQPQTSGGTDSKVAGLDSSRPNTATASAGRRQPAGRRTERRLHPPTPRFRTGTAASRLGRSSAQSWFRAGSEPRRCRRTFRFRRHTTQWTARPKH